MVIYNMVKAKKLKNDEFYTQLTDIEKELEYYKDHFRGKVVFMNCDNPQKSKFWEYLHTNFSKLGLKKIISSFYDDKNPSYKTEYTGGNDEDISVGVKTRLKESGDFRSDESIKIMKSSDIIITNPPFSLFRDFMSLLVEYEKDFLIVGNLNSITYKDVFPLILNNKVWLGQSKVIDFLQPDGTTKKFGNIRWFTNLDLSKRHEYLILRKKYNEKDYPKYDNFNAIEVNKVSNIPKDYDGIMGVPITYLDKHNPNQFEILAMTNGDLKNPYRTKVYSRGEYKSYGDLNSRAVLKLSDNSYKILYVRLLIKRKGKTK